MLCQCIGGLHGERSGEQHSHHKLVRVYTGCHSVSRKNTSQKCYATIKEEVSTIQRHMYNQNTSKKPEPVKVKVSKPQQ
jgi:hypothetical protein